MNNIEKLSEIFHELTEHDILHMTPMNYAKYLNDLHYAYSGAIQKLKTMQAECDALAARVQRGGVEFDVTPEDMLVAWEESPLTNEHRFEWSMSYLAEHATVVTPGDLPTVKELCVIYFEAVKRHPTTSGSHETGMTAVLAHLRPWIHPRDIGCIFCDYIASNLTDLREHSATCESHPLYRRTITRAEFEKAWRASQGQEWVVNPDIITAAFAAIGITAEGIE
jgi:hypothetical protein